MEWAAFMHSELGVRRAVSTILDSASGLLSGLVVLLGLSPSLCCSGRGFRVRTGITPASPEGGERSRFLEGLSPRLDTVRQDSGAAAAVRSTHRRSFSTRGLKLVEEASPRVQCTLPVEGRCYWSVFWAKVIVLWLNGLVFDGAGLSCDRPAWRSGPAPQLLGNYFGFYGFGNRPPYNSEEANEDEEPAKTEKESPKAESPVTESSNVTVDIISTTVGPILGNNATHNASLVGEKSQNVRPDGQNILPAAGPFIPGNNRRNIEILSSSFRPSHNIYRPPYQQNILRNPQHKYYTVNKILVGRGDNPNNIRPHNHLINKAPLTNTFDSGKMSSHKETQPSNAARKTDVLRQGHANGYKGIFQDPGATLSRHEGGQPHSGSTRPYLGDPMKHYENSPVKDHSPWQVNKNISPNQKFILVHPQNNEHINEYKRQPITTDQKQNIPRGMFSNQQPIQHQNKGSDQKNDVPHNKVNYLGQFSKVLNKNDGFFKQSEVLPPAGDATFYEKDGRVFQKVNTWNSKQDNTETVRINSGPQQETIFILSPITSSDNPVLHNNPLGQGPDNSLNIAWEKTIYQHRNPQYNILGQRNIDIYPETEFYGQASNVPNTGKQSWDNGIGFKSPQYDQLDPLVDAQHTPADPISQDIYIINDGAPTSERRYVLISNLESSKHTENPTFAANRPLYQVKHSPMTPHKAVKSYDFVDYDAYSQTQNKNIPHVANRQFETTESEQFNIGSELHPNQVDPIHLQLSPYSEMRSWSYNPVEFSHSRTNYDTYPSGMRGQPSYQKEVGIDYGGSRHYTCTLPIVDGDLTGGHTNQLLYVCCKLSDVQSGTPSVPMETPNDFRLTLNEYNEWVPYQDRTHRQHTRNVLDSPNVGYNQNSNTLTKGCNITNYEKIMTSEREHPETLPCLNKGCHDQKKEHPHYSLDVIDSKPCSRGDSDIDLSTSPKKIAMTIENTEGRSINIQDDGSLYRRIENDVLPNKATGKLLRILTCSKDRQNHTANILKNLGGGKPSAFSLKHDIPIEEATTNAGLIRPDGSSVLYQPQESKVNADSSVPDCLVLNK
ncbi:Hypothetical predicted protein [Pelobates cultripes]|uniref:Enamelin n=1 Tax=Pelobates cultripes TaxID=61616 RepID=A0AAD1WE77_PELCU|nr:Hypothetical predicted protein [Pelobates cultripes]